MDSKLTLLAPGIILAGAALVAAPWAVGQKIEKDFRAGFEETAAASAGAPVELKLVSYERGFWSSTARSQLKILPGVAPDAAEDGKKPGPPPVLNLEHRIDHGLGAAGMRYARITTDLLLDDPKDSAIARFFGGASPLTVTLNVSWDGKGSGSIRSPATQQTLTEDGSKIVIVWSGLDGRYSYDPQGGSGSFEVAAPAFRANAEVGAAEISGLGITGSMYRSADSGLWLGESSMLLDKAQAEMLGKGFQLDKLSVVGESREASGLVSSSMAWRSKRIAVGEDVVSDLALKFTASNLDAKALKAVNDATSQPGTPGSEAAQAAAAMQAIMAQLPAFLAKKPQLTIDEGQLSFNGSALEIGGRLRYVGDPSTPFSPADIEGQARVVMPRELLVSGLRQRLEKEAQLQALQSDKPVDVAALVEAGSTQMIDTLVAQGMLLAADDGRYSSEVKLQQGSITVNGLPFQGLPGAGGEPGEDGMETERDEGV